jgi:hypothetical protein
MNCFFTRIGCCGNMITELLSSNGHLSLPPLLRLSAVMSQNEFSQTTPMNSVPTSQEKLRFTLQNKLVYAVLEKIHIYCITQNTINTFLGKMPILL